MSKKKLQVKAFTLIELLVVIAIIGILSSVVLASLSGARESARATRIVSDFNQIETALSMYRNANSIAGYPTSNSFNSDLNDGKVSLQQMVDHSGTNFDDFLTSVPSPPGGDMYVYKNNKFDAGTDACGNGDDVQLKATAIGSSMSQKIDEILDDGDLSTGMVTGGSEVTYKISCNT